MENVFVKKANKVNFVKKKLEIVILMINFVEIMELVLLEHVFVRTLSLENNVMNKKLPKMPVKEMVKNSKMGNVSVKLENTERNAISRMLIVKTLARMVVFVLLTDVNALLHYLEQHVKRMLISLTKTNVKMEERLI